MLKIELPGKELFDEESNNFYVTKAYTLNLEHSLISLSKWESKWCKPFLIKGNKSLAETVDYIKCMTITQNVPDEAYLAVDNEILTKVAEYIEAPMTATTISNRGKKITSNKIITSEVVYSWMVMLNIPFECQKWHLNRLLMLINVCNIQMGPQKKMSRSEIYAQNRQLNAMRRAKMGSKG